MRRLSASALAAAVLLLMSACSGTSTAPSSSPAVRASTTAAPVQPVSRRATHIPRPAHVVIVVEENHDFTQTSAQPYLAQLARTGAVFTDSHGVTHPSEPNYLALWSGSTHGVASDACPIDLGSAPSLGGQLLAAHRSVVGYFEGLPKAGAATCSAGAYARKHNPLADFRATVGAAHNKPISAFPHRYSALPAVSLVVPDLGHDMHDGSVRTGDTWLRRHLGGYATWARTHDSLLVVTFDENDGRAGNRILTVFSGQHVRPGSYGERIDHRSVLHTVEAAFGLRMLGGAARPISNVWR